MDIASPHSAVCSCVLLINDSLNQIESDGDGHEHGMRFSFFMMHIIDIILLPYYFFARKTTRAQFFESIVLPSQKCLKCL